MCDEEKKECKKPDKLKGKPEECSPEQIKECHGDVKEHPCSPKEECQKPENLKGKPEECSEEQIKKCHGDAKKHRCDPGKSAK